ncbi:TetR family transcriptional regulator [Kineococcus sp. T13]|uniref:TetR family transcriptional regulator n=1 Tax=Kineococcus vitellinus TaxID=2696565 RepID=UPI0014125648|nr:TetR family transcriptional regulator [Kineococcus vitellinus]
MTGDGIGAGVGDPPKEDGRRLRYRHRREELLQAATEHVVAHGLAQASLRRVAEAAGVSHAALLHHFGTRERLLAEIVERVLTRAFSAPALRRGGPDGGVGSGADGGPLRALWAHATSPSGQRYVRLFLAITGSALYDEDLAAAVRASVRERTGLLAEGLVAAGAARESAGAQATLVLSAMRGLVLDRMVTGDAERVDAAFEAFVRGLERDLARRSGGVGAG